MALKNKGGNYLKIAAVSLATETGVVVTTPDGDKPVNRITATVSYNIYRSEESRRNGVADEFETVKTHSVAVEDFPPPPDGFEGTPFEKAIATGYVILKAQPEFATWEDS